VKKRFHPMLLLLAGLAALPLAVKDDYYLHLVILFFMWVVIGTAWNLIAGYTGQVSFGDAAFFGSGAYASGLLFKHFALSPWWGLATGGLAAVAVGFPFGWICFRMRGAYFALATLALNEVLRHSATVAEGFTGGMVGILIMPSFVSKIPYYYIALAMAAATLVSLRWIVHAKPGYYFVSIREDQDAAESFGIDTHFYKMVSLAIAAFWTGSAGALYMNYMGFIDPDVVFSLHDISIMAILVGIVGGVGTVYGPTVGAFIMVAVQELFRSGFFGLFKLLGSFSDSPAVAKAVEVVTHAHVLGFGVLVVVVILVLPNGIVGDWPKIKRRFSRAGAGR